MILPFHSPLPHPQTETQTPEHVNLLLCPETGPATQTSQGLPSWGLESSLL